MGLQGLGDQRQIEGQEIYAQYKHEFCKGEKYSEDLLPGWAVNFLSDKVIK